MRIYIILFFVLITSISCNQQPNKAAEEGLYIVTTTGMLGDAVQNITREHARVVSIMGPGVDPHLYKASQGDLDKLLHADMVVYNGLFLEGKMESVLKKLGRQKTVYAAGESIPVNKRRASVVYKNAYDPHIWFDIELWSLAIRGISEAIIQKDPAHRSDYEKNTAAYLKLLSELHIEVAAQIKEIPPSQRVLVTAHDAFEYFGAAYGMEVKGLQGISTSTEAGLKDISELVDFIVKEQTKAVFIETSVSKKAIEAVIEGCQEKGSNVVLGGSLYSDAMGNKDSQEGNYIGMFKSNVNTIKKALQ